MLLSPITGIYLALSNSQNQSKEYKPKVIQIEEFIVRADGFEPKLLKTFAEVLRTDTIKVNPHNKKAVSAISSIINSLDPFIEKHFSPVS